MIYNIQTKILNLIQNFKSWYFLIFGLEMQQI